MPPAELSVPSLSVVVPVFNEAPALPFFHERLQATLDGLERDRGMKSEVIAVNDGSKDGSLALLQSMAQSSPRWRVLELQPNRGQHEAVLAGFAATRSDFVVTLDADLQNPPEEIPRVVDALLEGHDFINTHRVHREDSLRRRLASTLANATTRILSRAYTSVPLHDIGCMLKGFRRELVEAMLAAADEPGAPAPFVPALAIRSAKRVCEIEVAHAPRAHGRSRYGLLGLLKLQTRLITTLSRSRRQR